MKLEKNSTNLAKNNAPSYPFSISKVGICFCQFKSSMIFHKNPSLTTIKIYLHTVLLKFIPTYTKT